MKLKILYSFLVFGSILNLYSQKDSIEIQNKIIISSLTNNYWTYLGYVYPTFYEEHLFRLPHIMVESTVAPDNEIKFIKETYFENKVKFGKNEMNPLQQFNVEYYYNGEGLLNKIIINGKSQDLNIGKYGELISKEINYETNEKGISKILFYSDSGNLSSRGQINYNTLGQIVSYDSFEANSTFKRHTKEFTYDNLGKIIKITFRQNFKDKVVKSIPREVISYNYKNLNLRCTVATNNFGEGRFELSDFSKLNGLSVVNKTLKEINVDLKKRWINHQIFSERILIDDKKNDYWSEKKIYKKLNGDINTEEVLYTIIREYK